MKRTLFAGLFILAAFTGFTRQLGDTTRFIEVNGEAEMEVEADKITIEYMLSYSPSSYDSYKPTEITTDAPETPKEEPAYGRTVEDMEKDIKSFLKKNGVSEAPTEKFQPSKAFSRGKLYSLTITNMQLAKKIMVGLDSLGAKDLNVAEISHSKIESLKSEVERKALVAAKDKAVNLLSVFNEAPGRVLEISEKQLNPFADIFPADFADDFKKIFSKTMHWPNMQDLRIKIKYSIRVKFEIR